MLTYMNGRCLFILIACHCLVPSPPPLTAAAASQRAPFGTGDTTKRDTERSHEFLAYVPWINTSLHDVSERLRVRRSSANGDFSEEDKTNILDFHNRIRASLGASNMIMLEWNSDLETEAKRWASLCDVSHPSDVRKVGRFDDLGQNLFFSTGLPSAESILEFWSSEAADYDIEKNSCTNVCGHYVQMIWASTEAVGCALKLCDPATSAPSSKGYFAVCEYGPGGNAIGQKPYTEGTACSDCPGDYKFCQDNLCALTGGSTEAPDSLARPRQDPSPFGVMLTLCYSLLLLF